MRVARDPLRKWILRGTFVEIYQAAFGVQQEAVSRDGAGGAVVDTGFAFLASFQHNRFMPGIVRDRQVAEIGDQLDKAAHASVVSDVVATVFAQSTADSQGFERQCCPDGMVALWSQTSG